MTYFVQAQITRAILTEPAPRLNGFKQAVFLMAQGYLTLNLHFLSLVLYILKCKARATDKMLVVTSDFLCIVTSSRVMTCSQIEMLWLTDHAWSRKAKTGMAQRGLLTLAGNSSLIITVIKLKPTWYLAIRNKHKWKEWTNHISTQNCIPNERRKTPFIRCYKMCNWVVQYFEIITVSSNWKDNSNLLCV